MTKRIADGYRQGIIEGKQIIIQELQKRFCNHVEKTFLEGEEP